MSVIQRISREPVAIAGVLLAAYGVLVAFDVLTLTDTQMGALTTLGGAIVFAIRWLTTPSSEVVAVQPPDAATPRAGAASDVTTGAPVAVVAA